MENLPREPIENLKDITVKEEFPLTEEAYENIQNDSLIKTESEICEPSTNISYTEPNLTTMGDDDIGNPCVPSLSSLTNVNTVIPDPNVISNLRVDFKEDFDNPESPYLQIKQELTLSIENDDSQSSIEVNNIKQEETESILPINYEDVKVEKENESVDLPGYSYASLDDSLDSSDAAALSQVEACLSDDLNIKTEDPQLLYDVTDENSKNFPKVIKEESELTVTETHLISNKLINTTSTVTSSSDGAIIESQTTKTLVMEILPVPQGDTFSKMGNPNPEEILPTCPEDSYDMDCDDEPFQLNSITGNILSLEQEAYGLLKANKKSNLDEKVYYCQKCSKTYTKKASLRAHYKMHESIERRTLGNLKGLQTRRIQNLNKKVNVKVEEEEEMEADEAVEERVQYTCTCGQQFHRRSRMETCLRSHTDSPDVHLFSCPTCYKKFKSKELLSQHRHRQHRKKYPCKFCPTDYPTQKELFKHLQLHQKVQLTEFKVISEVADGKELLCLLCTKSCSKLCDFKSHVMEEHREPYKCPGCDQNFLRIAEFAHHIKKIHPDIGSESVLDVLEAFSKLVRAWKCEECGKQFHQADKLALHQVEEHTAEAKAEQHFQCEDCQRVFVSNQGLHSHRRVHHRAEPAAPPPPEDVGVMCLECRKVCADMTALTSHMRLHSPDRKYPCKFCDFRFATPQKRKAHAEIHTGDMKYVCFICEYQCTSGNRLKHHKMSVKHLNMKEYLLTGKPLVEMADEPSKESVKKKKRRDRDAAGVPCDICGERFHSERDMLDHKQTHPFIEFPNDDKPTRIFFK